MGADSPTERINAQSALHARRRKTMLKVWVDVLHVCIVLAVLGYSFNLVAAS